MGKYSIKLEWDDDAKMWSAVHADTNVSSYGKTRDQALWRIKEALELWLDGPIDPHVVEEV